jgi:hypothetical protein
MMMATLLAINNYYYYRAGAETVFLEHSRMFEAMGWTVVPFAMRHPRNLESPWAEFFIEEIEFDTKYSLFEKLRRIPKVIYSFEATRQLSRLLDRVRPDACPQHLSSYFAVDSGSVERPRHSNGDDFARSQDSLSCVQNAGERRNLRALPRGAPL